MGGALVRGMLASGITSGDRILLSSSSEEKAARSATELGVKAVPTNAAATAGADVVFLCVKPAKALAVLSEAGGGLQGKLLVSVVAGIRSADLLGAAGPGVRLIRAMPNTAVRLRKGVTALAPHSTATEGDLEMARTLFSSVGAAVVVREEDLDTVTAVSGSGPAFALLMLEDMIQGGVEGGLSPEDAKTFAAGALAAASALVLETGETPLALRAEITSPGGTTAAGLTVLEEGDFRQSVRGAVRAARSRSAELSNQSRHPAKG